MFTVTVWCESYHVWEGLSPETRTFLEDRGIPGPPRTKASFAPYQIDENEAPPINQMVFSDPPHPYPPKDEDEAMLDIQEQRRRNPQEEERRIYEADPHNPFQNYALELYRGVPEVAEMEN
jgi:hypothetical protein